MHRLPSFLVLAMVPAIAPAAPQQLGVWKDAVGQIHQVEGVTPINPDGSTASPGATATSTPLAATITNTTATLNSGAAQVANPQTPAATAACSFSGGTGTCGPFISQLGQPVKVKGDLTGSGSWYLGSSTNGCATVSRLTSGSTPADDWTGSVNDFPDVPPKGIANWVYCVVGTMQAGASLSLTLSN